jgi:hypothetical protein
LYTSVPAKRSEAGMRIVAAGTASEASGVWHRCWISLHLKQIEHCVLCASVAAMLSRK